MRSECRMVLVTLTALLAMGCKRTATIEGDLSMAQGGAVRKGALQPVFLLRNGDSVSQVVELVCKDWKAKEAKGAARARDMDAAADRFKRASERASMRAGVALLDSMDKYRQAAAAERRRQQDALDSPYDRILAMVHAAADTQVETDLDAHYRVENLPPGRYVVYGEWSSDQVYPFWAVVDLKKGEEKKLDLDQATLATAKLRCQ